MEKIILVDGNNLLFRSYYATAYSGNFMKNSKGFPTNALYGFTNMINKIINEECPTYMIVAFDKGKTFRHEKYEQYKDGRIEMPDELKVQFPLAKELLTNMGIKYYECDNYEADDIIGTFAKYCDEEEDFIGTIVSSDKDLLQLISHDVDIKLLKQKDYIRYNEKSFKEAYGIEPINIIDLKALMGDSSDNIPGVKGIGEKTALKLLHDYKTLNGVYDNLDKLTPKMREKLENDKDNAYMSYDLATIYKEVPMEISIPDIKLKNKNSDKLNEIRQYTVLGKLFVALGPEIPGESFEITVLVGHFFLDDELQASRDIEGVLTSGRIIIGRKCIDRKRLVVSMFRGILRFSVIGHRPEHTAVLPVDAVIFQKLIGMICILF